MVELGILPKSSYVDIVNFFIYMKGATSTLFIQALIGVYVLEGPPLIVVDLCLISLSSTSWQDSYHNKTFALQ